MTIEQTESGLSVGEYNTLLAASVDPAFTVIAHKYNLDFQGLTPNETVTPVESDSWAACPSQAGDFWVYYNAGYIYSFIEDITSVSNPTRLATGITDTAKTPSLVETEGVAYFFTWDGSNIVRTEYNVSTSAVTFSATSSIAVTLGGSESLTHLAATDKDTVHYVIKDTATKLWNLRAATWNGATWDLTASNVFYMYPIQNFDATTDGTTDVLVVAAQIPGTVSSRITNDEVEKYIEASGGIICFTYKNGNWSDHYEIDTLDQANDWRMRRGPRITYMNGLFVATAYSVSGTEKFPFASYRIYTSKTGKNWSMGTIIPIDVAPYRRGVSIIPVGDTLMLCDSGYFYSCVSTLFVGYSAAAAQVDLTTYINDLQITHDKALQSDMVIDNSDGTFDSHAIIDPDNTILLVHNAGYGTSLVQVAVTEVDYMDFDGSQLNAVIKMTSRDRLAWMSDKTQSEEARYWEGQLVGADRFTDYTKTKYGGMRHTATQSGSWDSVDSVLQLRSNNEPGISFNTFSAYIANGSYRAAFKLAKLNNTEYAGIIFRAIDKDNFMEARYVQSDDKIHIYKTISAVPTDEAESSVMGWSGSLSWRYIKVDFRYGKVIVFSSMDSKIWDLEITYYQEGQHDPGSYGPVPLDKGYVGHIARGWAPDITWTFPDFIIPDYIWFPPDFDLDDFEVDFLVDPTIEGDTNYAIAVDVETNKLMYTNDFTSATPTWVDKSPTNQTTYYATFGAHDATNVEVWTIGTEWDGPNLWGRIFHTANIKATTPIWTEIDNFSIWDGVFYSAHIDYHPVYNVIAFSCETPAYYYAKMSGDDGVTWTEKIVGVPSHSKEINQSASFALAPNGTELFYIYLHKKAVGSADYILGGLSVAGGVYDDVLDTPSGSDILNEVFALRFVAMGNIPNSLRLATESRFMQVDTPSSFLQSYHTNSKANQYIVQSNNGNPQIGYGYEPEVYWEFTSGSPPSTTGNWCEMKWSWEDYPIWDSSIGGPEMPDFLFTDIFTSATDFDTFETWTWITNLGTRIWTKENISVHTGGGVTIVNDPTGIVEGERILSLSYTISISNLVIGPGTSKIGVHCKNAGLGAIYHHEDIRSIGQIWGTEIAPLSVDEDEQSGELSIMPPVSSIVRSNAQSINVNYITPSRVGVLSTSPFSLGEVQRYLTSIDDVNWETLSLVNGPYDGLWINESGNAYSWKENRISDLSNSEISKNGNIGTILTSTWNLYCLETLE
jgi:hypothetical protein